ncbi:sugar ABC transporter ATP-binding protein [Acidobacteria bacterium AH-259-A15]|nr:sugar ABC transporter ATP-binding protein [Acidobacteria bacterium AH-259-A15]
MSLLRLSKISKRFGPTVALDDVDLELRQGEVHALIGENGAGKTTLMNILAGILQPDQGRMELEGRPYAPFSPLDARRQAIALIHQELSLFPHLSVSENILMGMESSRWGWVNGEDCRRRTLQVLEDFHHPEIRPDRAVAELPIAARQIVEICRAIAAQARIILMDEPTSSLQRPDVKRLFELIQRMRKQRISVIYISHFLEEVREIADRYTVLRDGQGVGTGELGSVSDENLVAQMVGRPVKNLFPPRQQSKTGETVLRVEDLAAPPSVKHASFELRRGEILGIGGLIGSGRTQMVRAIFGLAPVESGILVVGNKAVSARRGSPLLRIVQGIGYLSEDRKGEGLAVALSVADNVTLSRLSSCSRWGWLALDCQRQEAQAWIRRLNIKARTPSQPTWTLSGGNQQKVVLARLLHQDADILLLDEPTRGIDIGSKIQIYEAIAQCASEDKAVLMVSSYLPELFGLCHRLAVMSRGRLSATRSVDEWTPETVMQTAIGGGE